jgi:hypothetical protein
MKHKVGDKYFREYLANDEEGNEMASLILQGEVVYSNETVFIVIADSNSHAEIAIMNGLLYERCRTFFPDFEYNKFSYGKPLQERFVPMNQEDEEFLFFEEDYSNSSD